MNVVDLMTLFQREAHPHGMSETTFIELFTADKPVIFAFHGYQRAIHEVVHGHVNTQRFHVRGFNEQGTTTTPFNMVVLNRDEPVSPLHRGDSPCGAIRAECDIVDPGAGAIDR